MNTNASIISELQDESKGLYFVSEADHPFATVDWQIEDITPEYLSSLTTSPTTSPTTKIEELPFTEFYDKYAASKAEHSDAKRARAGSYKKLFDVLKDNLTDLKVYRLGEVQVVIYIVGRSRSGGWLGLSTEAVETS